MQTAPLKFSHENCQDLLTKQFLKSIHFRQESVVTPLQSHKQINPQGTNDQLNYTIFK